MKYPHSNSTSRIKDYEHFTTQSPNQKVNDKYDGSLHHHYKMLENCQKCHQVIQVIKLVFVSKDFRNLIVVRNGS